MTESKPVLESLPVKAQATELDFFYGDYQALKKINVAIYEKRVTALIGPSGCGKSTFLRCFNRMHDLYPGTRYQGEIRLQPQLQSIDLGGCNEVTDAGVSALGAGH